MRLDASRFENLGEWYVNGGPPRQKSSPSLRLRDVDLKLYERSWGFNNFHGESIIFFVDRSFFIFELLDETYRMKNENFVRQPAPALPTS